MAAVEARKGLPLVLLSALSMLQARRDVLGDPGVVAAPERVPEVRQSSLCSSVPLAEVPLTAAQTPAPFQNRPGKEPRVPGAAEHLQHWCAALKCFSCQQQGTGAQLGRAGPGLTLCVPCHRHPAPRAIADPLSLAWSAAAAQ